MATNPRHIASSRAHCSFIFVLFQGAPRANLQWIFFRFFNISFDRLCVADHEYHFPGCQNPFPAEIFAKYGEGLKKQKHNVLVKWS